MGSGVGATLSSCTGMGAHGTKRRLTVIHGFPFLPIGNGICIGKIRNLS